ncbi:unnamed protein product [Rotaria sp. Silwood2]|nr:unnamed protein product [Rotaria sp. Silwood2]CAF4010470.1 unnamed protein product [Rotaria sp. Silwood2]
MSVSKFEYLPVDIIFDIFDYLSPLEILQSFLLLNKRFSKIVMNEYLWHICIGDNIMSLSMFNNLCQNVLKLIGRRVVSLRITLSHVVGGWSLISSSLQCHQKILLQRLHLIDIKPHELDKLLCNHLIKQIHTLLIDMTSPNLFHDLKIEGVYLTKVCSQLPLLRICRLPFNHEYKIVDQLEKCSLKFQMILPNLSNTIYLRKLTIGTHTSQFIERLLTCIPFIENLSFGVYDPWLDQNKIFDINSRLPASVNSHILLYLSHLHIDCTDNISFHRIIALLSSIFGQLSQLSLKLEIYMFISDPFIILGDTFQNLCIDRLKPWATYILNLSFYVEEDLEEKIIFNSFLKSPFIYQKQSRVIIQECSGYGTTYLYSFFIYTLPYNGTILPTNLFAKHLEQYYQMSANAADLFPCANELLLVSYKDKNRSPNLPYFKSPTSSLIPWSLFTKISIEEGDAVRAAELETILQMAYNVYELDLGIMGSILLDKIFHNDDNLGTRINQQIQSLDIDDISLTLDSAQRFFTLLSNQLFNLKKISFCIYASYRQRHWRPSSIIEDKSKCMKHIVNLIYFLVHNLQQLISLQMKFSNPTFFKTTCFPNLIRQQLHQYPLSRPYRLHCSSEMIQIWL